MGPRLYGRSVSELTPGIEGLSGETDISAEQTRTQTSPRVSRKDGDGRRPSCDQGAARARPQEAIGLGAHTDEVAKQPRPLAKLKHRHQFLAAAKGSLVRRPGFVLQWLDRKDGRPEMGLGLTASRKVGGSVVRNRARRRLRELAREVLPVYGSAGLDYVLIARRETPLWPFAAMRQDLIDVLKRTRRDVRRSSSR